MTITAPPKQTVPRLAATQSDPRWNSVVRRDPAADGTFYYSVKSTGVYCRPSCAARLARPENVAFHLSCEDAERAGFRPCKRCKPRAESPHVDISRKIAAACRLIESSEKRPTLRVLAETAGLSTFHFHRVFKGATGLTPTAYAAAHRAGRVRTALRSTARITDAIYDAGFNSSSRFYETSAGMLGMTPADFRSGAPGADIHYATGTCSLGTVLVARSERGICSILLGDDPDALARDLHRDFPRAGRITADPAFDQLLRQVIGFLESPGQAFPLPLDIRGTAFQRRVWTALSAIPAGSTASYGEIARRIGTPKAMRAVAQACAANQLAVAIPCHRVVHSDGALSGYRWGVSRKRALLSGEADRVRRG